MQAYRVAVSKHKWKKGGKEKRYMYVSEEPTTQFFNSDLADILQSKCKKYAYGYSPYLHLSNHFKKY